MPFQTFLLLSIMCLVFSNTMSAQESFKEEKEFSNHRLAVVLGHTHVPTGLDNDGAKTWLILPSWGLDYDFSFNDKWALGLHSDIVVENFELEEQFGETGAIIKRTKPLAFAVMVSYKSWEHVVFMLGAGGEYSKEETFILARAGLEYSWEIGNEWELGISLMNDLKINAYNSWVFGLGVSKFF